MNDIEDAEIVTKCKNGDTGAFSKLVNRYGNAVFNLAYCMCGNASSAEDLAQESFIRAYRRLYQYKPEYPFRNWLLGICANLCRSRYRWWRRKRNMEKAYADEAIFQRETQRPDSAARNYRNLEQALMALPDSLRVPVILKYMEEMTIQEVADTLGIRLSAAKMRLSRGREQLCRILRNPAGKDKLNEQE